MEWKFAGDKPIYQQIMEQVRRAILQGEYLAGERIPSVRVLAAQARVNPNTMQRALTELEREKLLANLGTMGRCVTEEQAILEQLHQKMIQQTVNSCVAQFRSVGLTVQQAVQLLLAAEARKEE